MKKKYKLFLVALAITTILFVFFNQHFSIVIINMPMLMIFEEEKPITIFGCIADIQYADIEDRFIYGRKRYYRNGIEQVKRAVADWKKMQSIYGVEFKFVLQLGDLLDVRGHPEDYDTNVIKILNEIRQLFSDIDPKYNQKILHLLGNHETAAFINRNFSTNISKQIILNDSKNYYYVDITNRIRLICLNLFEVNIYETNSHDFKKNYRHLVNMNSTGHRFNGYNGAASQNQLRWLKKQLEISKAQNKKVILAGHSPLLSNKVADINVAWNAEQIVSLIRSFDDLVICYLAGHFHQGGYFKDAKTHHLTLNSILEAKPTNSLKPYVTGLVYENRLVMMDKIKNKSFSAYF
jgi:hypothetical protein